MKIKKIKKLKINSSTYDVKWVKNYQYHGSFNIPNKTITFSTSYSDEDIFETICHELWELAAVEMSVSYMRPDCSDDFIFVYDHRQHTTMCAMVSGWLLEFIQ